MAFFWWFSFKWASQPDLSFGAFLFILAYAILLFLLAVVLVPVGAPQGFDFGTHFLERGRIFFGGLVLVFLIDIVDSTLKGPENLANLGPLYPWVIAILIVSSATAMLFRSRRYHWFFAIFWPALLIAWILHNMGAISVLRGAS